MDVIVKWTLVGLYVLNVLVTISLIGKPRGPITPSVAAAQFMIAGTMAVAVILTWDTSR